MKHNFVKNENFRRYLAAVSMLENRGAPERCILGVTGKPGVGKTRVVDNVGSEHDAVFLEGIPGMSLRYVRDALKAETGVAEKGSFAEFTALVEFFRNDGAPKMIILDECQHGFHDKAACIEYLRRLAEKAGSVLVLVCHSSEAHLLDKYDHIKTRVGCVCELKPPSAADTAQHAAELCEVGLDAALIAEVQRQSGARYRLIADAFANLERIGKKMGKTQLALADVAGMPLCQDWEKALKRQGVTPLTRSGA
jgi:hypothetical protein